MLNETHLAQIAPHSWGFLFVGRWVDLGMVRRTPLLLLIGLSFGQPDPIWTFNEYWGLLPDGVGLSAGGAIDRQNDGVLDLLYTTDIGVNEDIIIYPMGLLINDGSGGLSLGSDSLLINAESTQSGKIYVFDFNKILIKKTIIYFFFNKFN